MIRSVTAGGRRLEYVLVQSVRKSIVAKALPGGEFRVYAPMGMRLRDIDDFVRKHADQLFEMRDRVDAAAEARAPKDGMPIRVEGTFRTLRLMEGTFSYTLTADTFTVHVPAGTDEREAVRHALVELSLKRFEERLKYYSAKMNARYGRVTIREQRTRWGSCSSKNNLNFNWKLIMAPPEALDYVVIHELCHLTEFNHSPRFWSLVEAQMPEYKYWKKWLDTHGKELGV